MINITREEFYEFIKKKKDNPDALTKSTQHYLNYFDKYKATGKKINWNWPAFLTTFISGGMGSTWWLYRRMYAYCLISIVFGLIVISLPIGVLKVLVLMEFSPLAVAIPVLSMTIFTALYADYIYLYYASKKISKGKTKSGVNIWLVILMAVLGILLKITGAA